MDVRIIPVKRSISPSKTDSTQAANQNSKCKLQIISEVASLSDDLPSDRALLFPDDPFAYVGRAMQKLNTLRLAGAQERTTSASTSATSPSSSATLDALPAICPFNSSRHSARIRPISLMVVQCSPAIFSIFRVTRLRYCNGRAVRKCWEQLQLQEITLPYFSEIAEFSARTAYVLLLRWSYEME